MGWAPPAVQRAGVQNVVADHGCEVGTVAAPVLVTGQRIGHEADLRPGGKAITQPGHPDTRLRLFARRVLEGSRPEAVGPRREFRVGLQPAQPAHLVEAPLDPGTRGEHCRRVGRWRRVAREVRGDGRPGKRPCRDGGLDDAGVGQQLDVVAQREVARLRPRIGAKRGRRKGQYDGRRADKKSLDFRHVHRAWILP